MLGGHMVNRRRAVLGVGRHRDVFGRHRRQLGILCVGVDVHDSHINAFRSVNTFHGRVMGSVKPSLVDHYDGVEPRLRQRLGRTAQNRNVNPVQSPTDAEIGIGDQDECRIGRHAGVIGQVGFSLLYHHRALRGADDDQRQWAPGVAGSLVQPQVPVRTELPRVGSSNPVIGQSDPG